MITNAKINFPPFDGWGNLVPFGKEFIPTFICDEMIFAESVSQDALGEYVKLNGNKFYVTYDKNAIDHIDGCILNAEVKPA